MRILVHDYPGHPFEVQLSRELAQRGHKVLHIYAGYNVTPRGELKKKDSDPEQFDISPIFIREPLKKYSFFKRWQQEREYGILLSQEIRKFQPDILISANTPLDAQRLAQKTAQKENIRFIFWLQDVIGLAAQRLLRNKLPVLGDIIAGYYTFLERELLKNSDHIVLITEDFQPLMKRWGIAHEQTTTIPNWATLNQLPVQSSQNSWAKKHCLTDKFCFMYTGTLGMKHNPSLLLELALHYQDVENVNVVVISEGPGANWLRERKKEHQLSNLLLMEYQPFEELPQVMGTADVLIALLEPEAGIFSVPSKVLTYLCAQRPLLLAMPQDNLAAKIVTQNKAGFVTSPNDTEAFIKTSEMLINDPLLRQACGQRARAYAEERFDIERIGDQFEEILINQTVV
ncbi:MAG: glycosyltransferase WbuB [Chloroflexota bacterium]|nr:MAG: glycosyltransferase WbuB [Chloroflexota bacterium]